MRNRLAIIVGVVVLVLGILSLTYRSVAFERTRKKDADLGPMKFHVEYPVQERSQIPRALSWTAIVAGAGLAGWGLLGSRSGRASS